MTTAETTEPTCTFCGVPTRGNLGQRLLRATPGGLLVLDSCKAEECKRKLGDLHATPTPSGVQ